MRSPTSWVILFDANLENVPPELIGERSIARLASRLRKRPELMILDRATHHFAMKQLRDAGRRGRPDIVHVSALSVTDTPAYVSGRADLLIHTIGDQVIVPRGKWRPPRNYCNFVGLMEGLLQARRAPLKGPCVLRLEGGDVRGTVRRTGAETVVLLSSHGRPRDLTETVRSLRGRSAAYLIGAYARGKPRAEVMDVAQDVVSIHPSPLSSSVVVARLLYEVERSTARP